jgi:Mce-associated membrane protein
MSDDDAAKAEPNTAAASTAAAATAKVDADATVQIHPEKTEKVTAPPRSAAAARGSAVAWLPVAAAFVAGVLLVAAVTAVVVFWKQAQDRGNQLDARDSALRTACDFGRQVVTWDSKNFDDYTKRVKDRSTADWGIQFDGASVALKDLVVQAQARSTAGDIHCAWESGDETHASVDLLITQVQTKAAAPQSQSIPIWAVVSMEKKDGKWLVSDFKSPLTNDMSKIPGPGNQSAPGPNPQPDLSTPPTPPQPTR